VNFAFNGPVGVLMRTTGLLAKLVGNSAVRLMSIGAANGPTPVIIEISGPRFGGGLNDRGQSD
jgi:hypothetical protein